MIAPIRRAGAGDAVLLWLACIFALATGAAVGFLRLQAAIDAQHLMTTQALAVAQADDRLVRGRDELEARERQLDDLMRRLDLNADHPTAVARFVREAAELASMHHTTLVGIDEGRADALDPRASAASVDDEQLESIPFDVTLSGSYRDLLATVRDFGRSPIALHVEVASIEQTHTAGDAPSATPLTARLHIGIERLRDSTSLAPSANTLPQENHDARYR